MLFSLRPCRRLPNVSVSRTSKRKNSTPAGLTASTVCLKGRSCPSSSNTDGNSGDGSDHRLRSAATGLYGKRPRAVTRDPDGTREPPGGWRGPLAAPSCALPRLQRGGAHREGVEVPRGRPAVPGLDDLCKARSGAEENGRPGKGQAAYCCLPVDEESAHRSRESKPRGSGTEATANGLHAPAGPGAGEGVPLQPVPHAPPPRRGGARALPVRAAGEGVVPEQAHALEEGPQTAQHQREEQKQEGDGQQQQQQQQQQRQRREGGHNRVKKQARRSGGRHVGTSSLRD
ncbi:uncharacterized protein AB9W97_019902 isoform 2-T2 [Spinachia spinachia]